MGKRAILYTRVSTDEQAKQGYGLIEQLRELEAYADRYNLQVIDTVIDDGYSGASRNRPGLKRIRAIVESQDVDLILAAKLDRFFRRASYQDLFAYEMRDFGVEVMALNGQPDDNPSGRMFNRMLASFAEYERDLITDRTKHGRLGRARAGKVIPCRQAPYGFDYDASIGNYRIDESRMAAVRLIFETVAETGTLGAAKTALERAGYETSRGGRRWSKQTIREMIVNDLYKPFSTAALAEFVSDDVIAGLDKDTYGIQWYNRRTTEKTHDSDKARTIRLNHKAEWIAVPVPNAGIPLNVVMAARNAIANNVRPANAGRREWPAKGFVYCPCGRAMTAFTTGKYHYYVCNYRQYHGAGSCEHAKHWAADRLETELKRFVGNLLQNPAVLTEGLQERIEADRKELEQASTTAALWHERLAAISKKRDGLIDLAADGLISKDELRGKLELLDKQRDEAQAEIGRLQDYSSQVAGIEDLEDLTALISVSPTGDVMLAWIEDDQDGPFSFRNMLQKLEIRAVKQLDGTLEVTGAYDPTVCSLAGTSAYTSKNTKINFRAIAGQYTMIGV